MIDRFVPSLQELQNIDKVLYGFSFADGETLLAENHVDVAILDINLPDKSGIELLGLIKTNNYPVKKVIIITEDPTETKKQRCLALGADYFFDKYDAFEEITQILSGSN